RQSDRDRRRQPPAGRRAHRRCAAYRARRGQVAGVRLARGPCGRQRRGRVDQRLRRTGRGGRSLGPRVRHPGGPGRAVPRTAGEGALHARGGTRMATGARLRRRDTGMTATGATGRKRLTTSAMIASFADPGQRTTPAPFGHALNRLAEQRPEIVGLSADLAKYTDMHIFRDAHPERFFQMGMAEQSMLGAAAGMAEVGLTPFASTYCVFASRRAYDFFCLDIAEPGLNVNVVGGLPGLTTGYGPSHQATEDMAILRGMPGLTIVDPCDSVDIEQAVPQLADTPGPTYLRLLRGKVPTV